MNKPMVSIVIPVYNGANYLKEAIDSALNQTYLNTEVIVINDGSNDKGATEKIALSFGNKIRYFNKKNGGVATALNMGIENMNGDYFSWLSHDDLYHKDKIKNQIEVLSKLKDKTALITCGFTRIDAKGKKINDQAPGNYRIDIKNYTDEQLRTPLFALLTGGCIFGCSLLIHKSHFNRVGKFNPALLTNDYDLWFRMMRNQELIFIRRPLAYKRLHDEQDTHTKSKFIHAIWFAYFVHSTNNLSDEELSKVFGSRQGLYEYIKNNFGLSEDKLNLVLNAKTIDEKQYLLIDETIRKQYDLDIEVITQQYNEEIIKIKHLLHTYESSLSWKLTKPLRMFKNIIIKNRIIKRPKII